MRSLRSLASSFIHLRTSGLAALSLCDGWRGKTQRPLLLSQKTGNRFTRGRFQKAALVSVWIFLATVRHGKSWNLTFYGKRVFTNPVFALVLKLFLVLADLFLEAVDLFRELSRRELLTFVIAGTERGTPSPAEHQKYNRNIIKHMKHYSRFLYFNRGIYSRVS